MTNHGGTMSENTTRCVICTGDHAAVIGYLCSGHHARLRIMLADVEDEACRLTPVPSMAIRMDSGSGSLASERAPARLEVLVHTDRRRGTGRSETDDDAHAAGNTLPILDVLHSWARLVREERGFATRAQVTISGERDYLTTQLDWIAEQPWCDEMYSEIRQLLGQLRIVNGTPPEKPVCVCPVTTSAGICGGNVWQHDETQAVWRRWPDRCTQTWESAPGRYNCDTCGAAWSTDAEKARLKAMTEEAATEAARPHTDDGRPMLTAEELVSRGAFRTAGAVRTAATRAGKRGVQGHYDPAWFVKASA